MNKQKHWESVVDKFYKDYDDLNTMANKHQMNGEISMVALEVYMGHILKNTCIHTLQKAVNDCYNEVINDEIKKLKDHKQFKVGRSN